MTVLIFGRGQLGTYYKDYFEQRGDTVVNPRVDIREASAVTQAITEVKPDVVINAAAKTDIDWCEQNQMECFAVNTLGADTIAAACEAQGVYLYHISSGCIQESKSIDEVHTEEDPVGPICFYAWTKVWAENLLMQRMQRGSLKVLILRPRQLLSATVSPRNAITKMLTYTTFINTPNSCTIVEDLMDVTGRLVDTRTTGVFNVVNPGVTTPLEIAHMLKEIINPEMEITEISKEKLNTMTLAERVDCVLSGEKLANLGIELKEIHERLREILILFKANLATEDSTEAMEKTRQDTQRKLQRNA